MHSKTGNVGLDIERLPYFSVAAMAVVCPNSVGGNDIKSTNKKFHGTTFLVFLCNTTNVDSY